MESNFNIRRIHNSIIISLSAKPKFYAYILLSLIVIAMFLPLLNTAKITVDKIMVFVVYIILMALFPLKYALWNVFGKETLVINRKSISYQYDYGFIRNNLTTTTYQNLSTHFQNFLIDKEKTLGKIHFYEEDEKTGLPNIFHITSIYITQSQYEIIIEEIKSLFLQYEPFSMN
ncbi:hypothetical protein PFY12_01330 [Chryseobacterium camelliae]|uniref:PH domain-containing protein n=1 Tax=Chryseobacterium camelliae TaxID=1265445 RepID=A0ABY7QM96_9FLAO|nr:hypothetical protein [Chryseobacterium camelliae]WBV60775.1 hypothetical protein PFY12_01330 [Chryseobacterium camelliae]